MREMDVKDSKSITSDNKALAMGRDLRSCSANASASSRSARAPTTGSTRRCATSTRCWPGPMRAPSRTCSKPCPTARAPSPTSSAASSRSRRALMKKGREIELVQRHRAESDLAVAAASIIAREAFLRASKTWRRNTRLDSRRAPRRPCGKPPSNSSEARGPEILLETGEVPLQDDRRRPCASRQRPPRPRPGRPGRVENRHRAAAQMPK